MKKIIYLSIALMFVVTVSRAQIPNFSFESWTSMGSYVNPDNWGTMNNTSALGGIFTATKATPGNPGSSYLKLTSKTTSLGVLNGIAVSGVLDSTTMQPISGFAYSMRPSSFKGKWQHMIYGTSQGSISVKLTKWNTLTGMRETVATANQTLSGMAMSWAAFSINFTYLTGDYPDTCIIVLKASGSAPTNLDYLWVDNLTFNGTVTGVENNGSFLSGISVFPNPSSTVVNIDLKFNSAQQTKIEITDLNGQLVLSKNAGLLKGISKQTLDVSSLARGSYFVAIITEAGKEVKKIIIE